MQSGIHKEHNLQILDFGFVHKLFYFGIIALGSYGTQ